MTRSLYLEKIREMLRIQQVCALLGPRQVGKTTIAHDFANQIGIEKTIFFDLENPVDLTRLENPMLALSFDTEKLIIIDEIQRRPELFPILRVLVDTNKKQKFLILGSASRDLISQSSETLAGRIGYIELKPFGITEVDNKQALWLRGGFPRSYLADSDSDSFALRNNYITTFLERDIPSFGFSIPPQQMRRFWLMLSHYHGQIFNSSEIGKSLGISNVTCQRYLDILTGTFMIRTLHPWFENIKKRQVKSPKIYFRDSGIFHGLLSIQTMQDLQVHPKLGASWEGFALEEITKMLDATLEECFFWSTHNDAEIDLFILRHGKRLGFEVKYADAPKISKSMRIAMSDLSLDHLYIVYPGDKAFPMEDKITGMGLYSISLKSIFQS